VRWWISIWMVRAAVRVMPRGTARDRLGDYVRAWVSEMNDARQALSKW
jgi:hypothetical protein